MDPQKLQEHLQFDKMKSEIQQIYKTCPNRLKSNNCKDLIKLDRLNEKLHFLFLPWLSRSLKPKGGAAGGVLVRGRGFLVLTDMPRPEFNLSPCVTTGENKNSIEIKSNNYAFTIARE